MGDPRQTAVSDLSKVIPWLVVPSFGHGILWTRVKQRNHSAMAAIDTSDPSPSRRKLSVKQNY